MALYQRWCEKLDCSFHLPHLHWRNGLRSLEVALSLRPVPGFPISGQAAWLPLSVLFALKKKFLMKNCDVTHRLYYVCSNCLCLPNYPTSFCLVLTHPWLFFAHSVIQRHTGKSRHRNYEGEEMQYSKLEGEWIPGIWFFSGDKLMGTMFFPQAANKTLQGC